MVLSAFPNFYFQNIPGSIRNANYKDLCLQDAHAHAHTNTHTPQKKTKGHEWMIHQKELRQ